MSQPVRFQTTGRGVRSVDTSINPTWALCDVDPIVKYFSWEVIHQPQTPTEATVDGLGISIATQHFYYLEFRQIVEKRFNKGDSNVLSTGQGSGSTTTQSYFRPTIDQLKIFSLPSNVAAADYVHGVAEWTIQNLRINFNKQTMLYTLTAELYARTKLKTYSSYTTKFTIYNWQNLPTEAEVS